MITVATRPDGKDHIIGDAWKNTEGMINVEVEDTLDRKKWRKLKPENGHTTPDEKEEQLITNLTKSKFLYALKLFFENLQNKFSSRILVDSLKTIFADFHVIEEGLVGLKSNLRDDETWFKEILRRAKDLLKTILNITPGITNIVAPGYSEREWNNFVDKTMLVLQTLFDDVSNKLDKALRNTGGFLNDLAGNEPLALLNMLWFGILEDNDSISHFTKSYNIDPENTHILFAKAITHYELQEYENALFDFNKLIKLGFSNSYSYYYKTYIKDNLPKIIFKYFDEEEFNNGNILDENLMQYI
ncbi:8956_t:CDS:2 [Funneliformis geosporum]|uniref:4103_t:CDS:1 n=1 Tax=Funneliformis geosporum TaxID=1117311 RepID=A0A9W4SR00_9GLOM|nr:8956_t:CDS:2 [Funneliformis geosporum]CAI2178235.1 4103_t:CDS:2 [Funneliformis geosporum]